MSDIYVGTLFSEDYLAHHGILGMKWGVRRYQNEDGTLTPAGKKRYDKQVEKAKKQYKNAMVKLQRDQAENNRSIYINSYNKTAREYNDYKTEEYNKKHKVTDEDYESAYQEQFAKDWKRNYNISMLDFSLSNANYKKAVEIANKYKLWDVDELAKKNKRFVDEMLASDYTLDANEFEKRSSSKS